MSDYPLLMDLHKAGERQGPGGPPETERALQLAAIDRDAPVRVADIGCGTGASALFLARHLNARITAVDLFQDFLDVLNERAARLGLADRITTVAGSMDHLPFAEGELDVLWSEGAIYNIGFETGVADWRRFLKTGGVLVASEITWTTDTRPKELEDYWHTAYPEIDVASAKIRVLETHGYAPLGFFTLPEHCWLDRYYRPLQARFDDFLERHGNSDEARALVDAERQEIALYETYKDYYSYGMYIARKR